MNTLFGQKVEQTQRFLENGTRIPVTVVSVGPHTVLSLKTADKHGYNAAQIGTLTRKKATRSQMGIAKKANLSAAPRFIKEVRFFTDETLPEVGASVQLADVLQPGDIIDVTATSKGKGWAGGVKRHNFRGGPRTHGQSDRERAPGSLGQTTTPGRVYKGKRMAGRMGNETVTVQNLFVADVVADKVYVAGLVPGHLQSIVTITKKGKLADKRFSTMLRVDSLDVEPVVEQPVTQSQEAVNEEKDVTTPEATSEKEEANTQ